jgi:hypothetical protein
MTEWRKEKGERGKRMEIASRVPRACDIAGERKKERDIKGLTG